MTLMMLGDYAYAEFGRPLGSRDKQPRKRRILRNAAILGGSLALAGGLGYGGLKGYKALKAGRLASSVSTGIPKRMPEIPVVDIPEKLTPQYIKLAKKRATESRGRIAKDVKQWEDEAAALRGKTKRTKSEEKRLRVLAALTKPKSRRPDIPEPWL